MYGDWAGKRLGQLDLVRPLGSGGMGEVWLARQDGLDRDVAVKILPRTTDRRTIDRLRREAGRWPRSAIRTWSSCTGSASSTGSTTT